MLMTVNVMSLLVVHLERMKQIVKLLRHTHAHLNMGVFGAIRLMVLGDIYLKPVCRYPHVNCCVMQIVSVLVLN